MNRSVTSLAMLMLIVGVVVVLIVTWSRPIRRSTITPRAMGNQININTADAPTLILLRGIGPRLADAIVEHRQTQGPFETVDNLDDVKGVGPRTLANLRDYITTR